MEDSSTSSSSAPLEFWDPHFHIWDVTKNAPFRGGHDPAILTGFTPGGLNYCYDRLKNEFAPLNGCDVPLVFAGGCFIDAMSLCHPKLSDESLNPICIQEARWVERELPPHFVISPGALLHASNAEETLAALAQCNSIRGIRQILNHRHDDPSKCYPRNSKDILELPSFRDNFSLLAQFDMHFEAHLDVSQFTSAAELFKAHPDVPVVINHVGGPTVEELTGDENNIFWKGMRAFAALSHTFLQISMLCGTDSDWDKNKAVTEAVHKLIALFGTHRCFFASNYPVDVKLGWPAERLFPALIKLSERYTTEDRTALFSRTARIAYRNMAFTSSSNTAQELYSALSSGNLATVVACHAKNVTITVYNRKDSTTTIHKGHIGARRFYRSIMAKAREQQATWTTVAVDKAQALLALKSDKGDSTVLTETSCFDSKTNRIQSTMVVFE